MEHEEVNEYVTPEEACLTNVTDSLIGHIHCNATWDTITCWPPTMADQIAKQPCPYIFGAVENSFVFKRCDSDGKWASPEMWSGFGYSDYSECVAHLSMIDEVFDLKQQEENNNNNINTNRLLQPIMIADVTLLAISLILLFIAVIAINCALTKPLTKSVQYRITINFYCAVFLEGILCLIKKIMMIYEVRHGLNLVSTTDSGTVCVVLISTTEFFSCAVYMWLALQTRHLKQYILSGQIPVYTSGFLIYALIGWGIPAIPTTVWAVALFLSNQFTCWNNYKYQPITWILDSSKLLVLVATAVYLIMTLKRVLPNSEVKRHRRCCHRMYLEGITCGCIFAYFAMLTILTILDNHGNHNFVLSGLCRVLRSLKGTVVSLTFLTLNADLRKCLRELNCRRHEQRAQHVCIQENSTDCV